MKAIAAILLSKNESTKQFTQIEDIHLLWPKRRMTYSQVANYYSEVISKYVCLQIVNNYNS